MPVVKVKDNEPFEVALKRFKKSVEKAGILTELRRREHFDKPSVRRKKKAAAARKRALKKLKREWAASPRILSRLFEIGSTSSIWSGATWA
jgi:small subunit ribosomal protein S21